MIYFIVSKHGSLPCFILLKRIDLKLTCSHFPPTEWNLCWSLYFTCFWSFLWHMERPLRPSTLPEPPLPGNTIRSRQPARRAAEPADNNNNLVRTKFILITSQFPVYYLASSQLLSNPVITAITNSKHHGETSAFPDRVLPFGALPASWSSSVFGSSLFSPDSNLSSQF